MNLTKDLLKKIIGAIKITREDEIGCGECFDKLHEFAEMELAVKSPAQAMPLVQDHLDRCGSCKEEYEALLEAMKTLDGKS